MHIGICKITLYIPKNQNLKGKRRIVKSVCDRLRSRFNIAIAEVDDHELWQKAIIGIACISTDHSHVQQTLSNILQELTTMTGEFELINSEQEIIAGI